MRFAAIVLIPLAVPCCAQDYVIKTLAGTIQPDAFPATPGSGMGGPVLDRSGNLYYLGMGGTSVWRYAPATGLITRMAGIGTPGFSGDGGPATSAQFGAGGLAVDAAGNLYISDGLNNRVRRVSNGVIQTVAGNGSSGFSGDGGPALNASLRSPLGLAVDAAGSLYIADGNNLRVRRVSNGIITTFAGNGSPLFNGENLPATAAAISPAGLTFDAAGNLFVADVGNGRIRKISNGTVTTVAGSSADPTRFGGDGGPAVAAQLSGPMAVAVDAGGNLYIADTGNRRIRKVTAGIITTVAGSGSEAGFSGDNGLATRALLSLATGVAADAAGGFYISDGGNYRIRRVQDGVITTVIGPGSSGDGGLAVNSQLARPAGLAVDAEGSVYITETRRAVIRKVTRGVLSTVAGGGSLGDGQLAIAARVASPLGVSVHPSGDVYVAEYATNRIRKIANGVITTVAGSGTYGYGGDGGPAQSAQLAFPSAIAVDPAGNLYIADTNNNRVRKVSNGVITTIAGTGIPGLAGDNGPAERAQLNFPTGLAFDAKGALYVSDGDRVRRIAGGIITTVAGTGLPGFAGDNGPAPAAQLTSPSGIAVDAAGNLYIVDAGNRRIRVVSDGIIRTIAGNGTPGFMPDMTPAVQGGLQFGIGGAQLAGIAADSEGNVYFAEGDRVRILVPSGVTCVSSARPTAAQAPATGGPVVFSVSASAACPVVAGSIPDWMYVVSATPFDAGVVTLSLFAAPNSGAPRSANIFLSGAFATVQQAGGALAPRVAAVVNAASGASGPVSPGEIIVIYGSGLGPAQLVQAQAGGDAYIRAPLAGTEVYFNGIPAPLLYTSAMQVAAIVPYGLSGGAARLALTYQPGLAGAEVIVGVTGAAPGLFTANASGKGQAAAVNPDGSLNAAANPVRAGSFVSLFATGEGQTWPTGVDGRPGPIPAPQPFLPVAVTIGGQEAVVMYAGGAPSLVAGLMQINVRIPDGVASGPAVPVAVQIGGIWSQPEVTLAIAR